MLWPQKELQHRLDTEKARSTIDMRGRYRPSFPASPLSKSERSSCLPSPPCKSQTLTMSACAGWTAKATGLAR